MGRKKSLVFLALLHNYGSTIIRQQRKKYPVLLWTKARAIKSGETPQKSLILPPVHTFIKVLVTPLNLMFSYFCRISGG